MRWRGNPLVTSWIQWTAGGTRTTLQIETKKNRDACFCESGRHVIVTSFCWWTMPPKGIHHVKEHRIPHKQPLCWDLLIPKILKKAIYICSQAFFVCSKKRKASWTSAKVNGQPQRERKQPLRTPEKGSVLVADQRLLSLTMCCDGGLSQPWSIVIDSHNGRVSQVSITMNSKRANGSADTGADL